MAETVTFVTSDDPPQTITVARAPLVAPASSKVFADILSIPLDATAAQESIRLDETHAEVKDFLALLSGVEPIDALSDLEWESLARCADKYDSLVGRIAAQTRVWKLLAQRDSKRSLHAFTLATLLNDHPLIEATAKTAGSRWNRRREAFRATEDWKQRLDNYVNRCKCLAYSEMVSYDFEGHFCGGSSDCSQGHALYAWQHLFRRAMETFNIEAPFYDPYIHLSWSDERGYDHDRFQDDAPEGCMCQEHRVAMWDASQQVEDVYQAQYKRTRFFSQ
ncbi:hypothetical protein JCM10207_001071 [Rhodosporidiobolus poonsookiae]